MWESTERRGRQRSAGCTDPRFTPGGDVWDRHVKFRNWRDAFLLRQAAEVNLDNSFLSLLPSLPSFFSSLSPSSSSLL